MDDLTPPDTEEGGPMPPQEFIAAVTSSPNLVDMLSDVERQKYGQEAVEMYRLDRTSMKPWLDRMERGIKLASLVKDDKTYPFDRAANVKYPLITSAALQFNARAYPAIVAPEAVVKAKVFGADPEGQKAARAERVSEHMSWQLLHQIEEWEEETDKLLVQLPIVGTMIRKVWYDPAKGRLRCKVLEAGKFIVNDRVRSLDDAPRLTEELDLYLNEIAQRERSGSFKQIAYDEDMDPQKPHRFIEQHCLLDLDDDGYDEPYILTVHVEKQSIVRLVADFEADDVNFEMGVVEQEALSATGEAVMLPVEQPTSVLDIRRNSYFIPYHFLPSLDGGFFGTGLGLLLGDITETINSTINMLMDAGHMASLGGGFIGEEFRIKGGGNRFKPGEWKKVAASGADVSKAMVPLTLPGPDATLYSLLGLLIEAGREIASIKDIMTGDSGTKNMTATTTMALIEQGMMVFTAAYKRIFRALSREFTLIAKINSETVSQEEYQQFHDVNADVRQDYNPTGMDIAPVADPGSITKMQQMAKAELMMQMAREGLVDMGAASEMVLEAAQIADREKFAPQPDPMAEPMAKMEMKSREADLMIKFADVQLTLAKVQQAEASAVKDVADADLSERKFEFEAMTTMLTEKRDELAQLIAGGSGGMAKPRRDSGPQGSVEGSGRPPAPAMEGAGILGQSAGGISPAIGLAG